MKIIKKSPSVPTPAVEQEGRPPWKILVVDDEEDVHSLTALTLKHFYYAGRRVELLSAYSGSEARALLSRESGIALAIVDVVMERDDAGLALVAFIREELHDHMVRLHIRTGQPGSAPERYVIDHYDIDGYSEKSELTAQRLYSLVRTSLKAYQDLRIIDQNRIGLSYVLEATHDLYALHEESLAGFFTGLLTQVTSLLRIGEDGMLVTIEGMIATIEGDSIEVRAGTGRFTDIDRSERAKVLVEHYGQALRQGRDLSQLPEGALLIPLASERGPIGFIYLEHTDHLSPSDRDLLQLLASHSASALENLRLHLALNASYNKLIKTLATAAEYKDADTGAHINRVSTLTERLARKMGFSADEARAVGGASRLHDVGKVGVPDQILQKPGPLTSEEFEVVKQHTLIGAALLGGDEWLDLARRIAQGHHERWDGKGYPERIAGEAIPLATRIVSVIDVYDALVNPRPYKAAWSQEQAVDYIRGEGGTRFDPAVVAAFLRLAAEGGLEA